MRRNLKKNFFENQIVQINQKKITKVPIISMPNDTASKT